MNFDPDDYYATAPWLARNGQRGRPRSSPPTLAEVEAVFGRWLYMPDPMPLRTVLVGLIAHHYGSDAPWPLLVGSTSGGKTAFLAPMQKVPGVSYQAVINRAGVLTSDRPKMGKPVHNVRGVLAPPFNGVVPDAAGIVAAAPGFRPIIVFGDFTAQTGGADEVRTQLMDDLRQIADGWWNRTLHGFDFRWASAERPEHATVIGGVTNTAIATAMADFGAKGQRFVFCRPPSDEGFRLASTDRALKRGVSSDRMHADLSTTAAAFVEGVGVPAFFDHPDHYSLGHLAAWSARARSVVPRDHGGQTGNAETEGPTRMARNLSLLYSGARAMRCDHVEADALMRRVAIDSIHLGRRRVIDKIGNGGTGWKTTTIAEALGDEDTFTRGLCSDLAAHGVLSRGGGDHWSIVGEAKRWLVDHRQPTEGNELPGPAPTPDLDWTDKLDRSEADANAG